MGIIHLDTKRHTLMNSNFGTTESPNGEFVLFEDYQALWDELAALKFEIAEKEAVNNTALEGELKNAISTELIETRNQLQVLCEFTDRVNDDWDDLLEDLEMHGMHGFEPYIRSKKKFGEMIADLPATMLEYHAKLLSALFPCFKCGANLHEQTRNILEDGIICTNCKLMSSFIGPAAKKRKDASSDMAEYCAQPFEADE